MQHKLTFIESTLGGHWAEYDGYKELEARNANMAKLLKAQGNKKDHGKNTFSGVYNTIKRTCFRFLPEHI